VQLWKVGIVEFWNNGILILNLRAIQNRNADFYDYYDFLG